MRMARRVLLGATLSATAMPRRARPVPPIRIGVLRFGTVSWEIDVIRQHALDAAGTNRDRAGRTGHATGGPGRTASRPGRHDRGRLAVGRSPACGR